MNFGLCVSFSTFIAGQVLEGLGASSDFVLEIAATDRDISSVPNLDASLRGIQRKCFAEWSFCAEITMGLRRRDRAWTM